MKISDIEAREGIVWTERERGSEYSLPRWYADVREKSLHELSLDDLGRFIRQELYLADILPYVLETLCEDPLAGALYRGQLLRAVSSLSDDGWKRLDESSRAAWAECIREARHEAERNLATCLN